MTSPNEILKAFDELPQHEQRHVADAILHRGDDAWDKQIEMDAQSGRLHEVFAEDIAEFKAGKCRKL